MPLMMESYDSLPYIDDEPSQHSRDKALALIQEETPADSLSRPHPMLPTDVEPSFSSLIQQELDRLAAGKSRIGGIDISRYEPPDEPSGDSDTESWRRALRNAYTSSTYLQGRQINLDLLEELGKNAWLVGNAQVESMLKDLEQDLEQLKQETNNINKARKIAQEDSKAELVALDETWRRGVSQVIEVQLAVHNLKRELLHQQEAHRQ